MDPKVLADTIVEINKKALTVEQAERRRIVDERCRRIQEQGVPWPASGTFGGKVKPKG